MDKRILKYVLAGFVGVLVAVIIAVLATRASTRPKSCPAGYDAQPPLILVCLDGFRADYRDRGLTPVINRLAQEGVSAPYMISVFPTVTFPNHYTIVTGLYPESHGIVSNKFDDPVLGKFSLGKSETRNGTWWGGEPIWNTLARQGKKSATYFWPGSDADIGGRHPTYWFPYKRSVPFEDRVDEVLKWVRMEAEERPGFMTVYFNEPDHKGHVDGPDSAAVNEQLQRMDGIINRLVTGLEDNELLDCVNLILVADHGMAGGEEDQNIVLSDYVEDLENSTSTYTGAFTMISPKNKSDEVKYDLMRKFACKRRDMRVFEKEGLPKRLHYSNNERIGDIILDADAGRLSLMTSSSYASEGSHGYDYYFKTMNALFIARGPGFKSGVETQPFQNIHLYNLMCHLTGVTPAPNNGTAGVLNDILSSPSPVTDLPKVNRPPVASYPSEAELPARLRVSGCAGDLAAPEDWLSRLSYSVEQQADLEAAHAPWGLPQLSDQSSHLTLLHQPDHVTGYSTLRQMPLWISYTVTKMPAGSRVTEWVSDVRLDASSSATCAQYGNLEGVFMAPLFHPGFSMNSSLYKIPFLVSNAVPSTRQQQERWIHLLTDLVPNWIAAGGLNVVLGPVFDSNADSIGDQYVRNGTSLELPSDLFAIVTRCSDEASISECAPHLLETRAFMFPANQVVDNCLEDRDYALKFSCTVMDVRTATGLAFFSRLRSAVRVRLETFVHQSLW